MFTWIRDLLGIQKDIKETKKVELEIEKLKAELRELKSIINNKAIDFRDVEKYDPKLKDICKAVERMEKMLKPVEIKPIWHKMDIIGKLLIPLVLGILTFVLAKAQYDLSRQQAEIQQREIKANIDLKYLEIFYQEINSKDLNRQKMAIATLKAMNPELSVPLLNVLAEMSPDKAIELSDIISQDQFQQKQIRSKAERIRYSISSQLKITKPSDGDNVDPVNLIHGETPFSEMRHYIIVTPLKTGIDYVQDEPAIVSVGLWNGRAKFGGADVGRGEKFAVRVLATKFALLPGPLTKVPEDAISSNSIIVVRKP